MITRFRGELEGLFKHNYLLPPLEFQNSAGLGWGPGRITDKFPGDAATAGWDHTLRTGAQGNLGRMHTSGSQERIKISGIGVLKPPFWQVPRQEYMNHNLRIIMTIWLVNLTTTGQCIRCHMSLNKNGNNVAWLTSRLTWCKEHRLWV